MNAAKLFLHAAIAGSYGAAVIACFLRSTNPAAAPATLAIVMLAYTLASGALWSLLYGLLRFFASRPLRLSWLSLRYVMGFHAVNTAVVVGCTWSTLSDARRVVSAATFAALQRCLAAVALAWTLAVVIAVVPRLRRRNRIQAAAGGLALIALVLFIPPAASDEGGAARSGQRRRPPDPPARSLVLLNFDGADLEDILTLEAQGKLPAFTRLIEEGAFGRLRSFTPCRNPISRATLLTGKLPYNHGVRGDTERSLPGREPGLTVVPDGLGFDLLLAPVLARRPVSASDRRCLSLWEIVGLCGGEVLEAGWDVDLDSGAPVAARFDEPGVAARLADLLDVPEVLGSDAEASDRITAILAAVEADDAVGALLEAPPPSGGRAGIVALSFPGLDRIAHMFLRYARPGDFGNVSDLEIERYGTVLEGYYRRIDALIDRVLSGGDGEVTLFVTSSHGIDPVPLRRRILAVARGREQLSGTHDGAPGGCLFAWGRRVRRGHKFGRGSIADVVPTALYALGLPVARDLDGKIRSDLFTPDHTLRHAVVVIDSYESRRRTADGTRAPGADPEVDRSGRLGYPRRCLR